MIGWILRTMAVTTMFLVLHGGQALLDMRLPWWWSLGFAGASYVVLSYALSRLFTKALTAPFIAKGAVLRGATLTVHSVACVPRPVRRRALAMAGATSATGESCATDQVDCEDDSDDEPACPEDWRFYVVDATVTPAVGAPGPFRAWAPGELILVGCDTDTSPDAPTRDDDASIHSVEVCGEDGAFAKDEGMSYEGEQRLLLTLACAPTLQAAKLRYYFEGFGRIDFAMSRQ